MGSISRMGRKAANCSWIILSMIAAAAAATAKAADSDLVARGAYLARAADCTGCHTAGPDHPPFAGGLPLSSPFGSIYSTNITPDPVSGIGNYTYEDFDRAVRGGVAKDGRHLYPAMPYPAFTAISDSDIQALYAFFMKGVKAADRKPPQTELPFPFNQRWVLRFWNAAFVKHERYKARADRDARWNRGAYLVQALGHCGACHTPRGLAYQEKGYSESSPDYLTGAVVDNWFAANLTGNRASGLGRWTEAGISEFLRTGHNGHTVAFGGMVLVIENGTQHLQKDDLDAMAHYLKSLPASGEKSSYKPRVMPEILLIGTNQFERPGAGLYSGFCAKCHEDDGTGKPPKIPRLAGNSMVLAEDATSLIRQVLEGGKGPATKDGPVPKEMPGFAKKFSDREIADVLTFIRNNWGNAALPVTTRDVSLLRPALKK